MALSTKAQVIERDLQIARSKANFSAFPELIRRYVKHNKDGVLLANTALLEMAVGEAEIAVRKAHHWTYHLSLDDTPEHFATSQHIRQGSIQEAVEKLERVLSKGHEDQQEYAAIVLARAAIATDAPDRVQRVAHYLQNIQLPPVRTPTGYNFALIACGMTVKGLALEEEGRIQEALVCYDNVATWVQNSPNEKCDQLFAWTEHALYRAGLLKLRFEDYLAAIRSFRAYHTQALTWPSDFRLPRRATVYRYLSQALTTAYKIFGYQSTANGSLAIMDENSQLNPEALNQELANVHANWEDALYAVTAFPRANEKNWRVVAMIEQIVEDRKLLGPGNDADKKALVGTIYRASQKTFQSHRLLRFLFFALMDMGQFDEAELALKAYLDMAEINLKVKSTAAEDSMTHDERVRQDVESKYDVTTVMIAGSRLFSKELGKPTEALKCASKALENIHEFLQYHEQVNDLLNNAYQCQGIAYGLQASTSHEPNQRPEMYSKAAEAFENAVKIAPGAFDSYYLLSFQYAEMREIAKAIVAVKQSISFNASHIPSWHLLALLLSSQKEYERALSICSVGLKESEWDLPQTDGFSASQLEGEDYLALRITQVILQDQVHGPEAGLEHEEALFSLYTRVFAPEPSSFGESMYDVQTIRRREQGEYDLASSAFGVANSDIGGRHRSGSILSTRSKIGGGSDIGSTIGPSNTLEVPKANYASSITSSIGSNTNRNRKVPPPAAAGTNSGTLGRSLLSLPPPVHRPTTKSVMRTARADKMLVTLWLMSASGFRRLGRLEDALKAIVEAERVDASNPDVWYQLGLLYIAQDDQETASVSFSKALALEPYHTACLARVGRLYLDGGSLEMAEGILESTTKSLGWDNAEAWFYLGKVFEATDRLARAKECLWYALDLETSRPIRRLTEALPRYA
ncbi:hypothetical protein FBU30_000686 [Linnemannia zychae]|nr:hypothetical protein FBU30_000686 [Linnemannia zychae]